MRLKIRGYTVRYDVVIPYLEGAKRPVEEGQAARDHVGRSVRKWVEESGKDLAYATVAISMFQRAVKKHIDPYYWMRYRGRQGSDILELWADEQNTVIERRARAHRRAMLASVR